ncbi:MAG: hypothetical protein GOVbin1230_40 [Prokaryotic dsDNA virus sp.]|nr:MAG: hypothetical protein GOVbin1230_40 [Prokaryotic dsDNA virus sp.]|tara:strand:- start:1621 stop:2109 length:489 start_codon:yes stop_codon:yes gene_type:complete
METIALVAPYISAVSTAVSAIGAITQGQYKQTEYNAQAEMTRLQASRDALEYNRKAVAALDKSLETSAAINARSGSALLDPFSGSMGNLTMYAFGEGYKDYTTAKRGADITLGMGEFQAKLYEQAGDQARKQGIYNAIGKFGETAMTIGSIGSVPDTGGLKV